jgi:hypothetical protein
MFVGNEEGQLLVVHLPSRRYVYFLLNVQGTINEPSVNNQ